MIRPGAGPRCLARKPVVSPSAMKQTSWLSGLSATARPRCAASTRTFALGVSPSGKMAWLSWSEVSTKPSARARSRTAANLIFSLQRRQGFGVRPAAYSETKSSTTSRWKRSAMSQT